MSKTRIKKFLELNRQELFMWRDTQLNDGMKVMGAEGALAAV